MLRRSNQKRKSVSVPQTQGMPRGSSSKKKKVASPRDKQKDMPGVARSPEQPQRQQQARKEGPAQGEQGGQGFEALLLAMEARLSAKIENQLELKVNANDARMQEALARSEVKITTEVGKQVKNMVDDQLKAAGLDQDLSAADLSVRRLASSMADSYARVASCPMPALLPPVQQQPLQQPKTKEERQEESL